MKCVVSVAYRPDRDFPELDVSPEFVDRMVWPLRCLMCRVLTQLLMQAALAPALGEVRGLVGLSGTAKPAADLFNHDMANRAGQRQRPPSLFCAR